MCTIVEPLCPVCNRIPPCNHSTEYNPDLDLSNQSQKSSRSSKSICEEIIFIKDNNQDQGRMRRINSYDMLPKIKDSQKSNYGDHTVTENLQLPDALKLKRREILNEKKEKQRLVVLQHEMERNSHNLNDIQVSQKLAVFKAKADQKLTTFKEKMRKSQEKIRTGSKSPKADYAGGT